MERGLKRLRLRRIFGPVHICRSPRVAEFGAVAAAAAAAAADSALIRIQDILIKVKTFLPIKNGPTR